MRVTEVGAQRAAHVINIDYFVFFPKIKGARTERTRENDFQEIALGDAYANV